METVEDVLEHYGVKGMRWGVRRTQAQLDAASADAQKKKSLQDTVKRNAGSTDPLSNADLKALNERLNLEQNYRQLVGKEKAAQPTPPIKKGAQFVTKNVGQMLGQSVKNIGTAIITNQIATALPEGLVKPQRKEKDS
jgi:hypothetical protein